MDREANRDVAILLYNDAERKLAEACVHRMVKRAVKMEGTVTVGTSTLCCRFGSHEK